MNNPKTATNNLATLHLSKIRASWRVDEKSPS